MHTQSIRHRKHLRLSSVLALSYFFLFSLIFFLFIPRWLKRLANILLEKVLAHPELAGYTTSWLTIHWAPPLCSLEFQPKGDKLFYHTKLYWRCFNEADWNDRQVKALQEFIYRKIYWGLISWNVHLLETYEEDREAEFEIYIFILNRFFFLDLWVM